MTTVPTYEEFQALQRKVEAMEKMFNQVMSAKVSVEWVGVDVAKIILKTSRTTVWRLIKNGELSVLKTKKKVQIGLNSIRAYLLKNKYEPAVVEARINSLLAT